MADNERESSNTPGDSELLRDLVEVQREGIQSQRAEHELRHKEIEVNADFATRALHAQQEDRKRYLQHIEKKDKRQFWGGLIAVIAVLLFLMYTLYIDKEEFALELIRIVLYGTGGYLIGRFIPRQSGPDES